jgi:outer membrane protein OmpA-like peptidoglycan-associated protein
MPYQTRNGDPQQAFYVFPIFPGRSIMRKRFLLAATTLAAFVPALAVAQARPAQPQPAAPRPATPPAAAPRQAAPAAASAIRAGSIELSGQAGVIYGSSFYDGTYGGTIGFGGFGRISYNVNEKLGIGAGAGFGSLGETFIQPFAGITYTLNNNPVSPFITAGVHLTRIGSGNPVAGPTPGGRNTSDYGAHAGIGIRKFTNENMAIRAEVRGMYDSYAVVGSAGMVQGLVGVSYFVGGGPPRDTDGDMVADRRDTCPNTPRGATVDARGCPQDTDRDGVYNGLDRCADTPANTPVDANGCTRDSDRDGIADNADRCPNTTAGTPVDANGCPRDADGDSVPDNADRCANTPRGTPVETTGERAGCPRDSDGDQVLDPADRCPATPAGTPVDANGCPRDTDGDGVWDNRDNCPNTAAGTQVDTAGCPVQRDADRDGVVDANDRCPSTPSTARVDANGCPLAELPAANATMVLRNVNFTTGTATLTAASRPVLDQIATAILATPNSRWEVGGHTDSRGVAATNLRLSQRRAQAVVDYLVSKGVPAAQLTAVGYGSRNPIQPNTTLAGRTANRRVEIKRLQ